MNEQEALKVHIEECKHRIGVINMFLETHENTDTKNISEGEKNIVVFKTVIKALEEIRQYRKIGTVDECRDAREKQIAKKPVERHYEDVGEPPYIKCTCPNNCGIQLCKATSKNLAHEHCYCPKCGQKIDWE